MTKLITDSGNHLWAYSNQRLILIDAQTEMIMMGDDPSQNGYEIKTWYAAVQFLIENGYIQEEE